MPSVATRRWDTKAPSTLKRNTPGRWPIEQPHTCPPQGVHSTVRKIIPLPPHANAVDRQKINQEQGTFKTTLALAAERLFDGTIQLSLCLGFPRRPLSAGANRRNRPKATDAAHPFERRPLFFKHLTAARLAEL